MKYLTRILLAPLLLAVALFAPGCQSNAKLDSAGAYHGDQFLYQSHVALTSAYAVLDAFVNWEYTNRALLKNEPAITKAADHVRANAKRWFASAHALLGAYEANPTPDNKVNAQKALAVIQASLAESAAYMAIPAPPAR